jgi:hypothetical protein
MTRKKKVVVPPRSGKPSACITCGKPLHRKSEHYCSDVCAADAGRRKGESAPPYLSKWKIRKQKELEDPLIRLRSKTRRKTRDLINRGVLKPRPCAVCGHGDVVPHHEDYGDPRKIIWLCEKHHVEYHDGKIALHGGKLSWDPVRLTHVGKKVAYPKKKYEDLKILHKRKTEDKNA